MKAFIVAMVINRLVFPYDRRFPIILVLVLVVCVECYIQSLVVPRDLPDLKLVVIVITPVLFFISLVFILFILMILKWR